jgi:hypothetical protein
MNYDLEICSECVQPEDILPGWGQIGKPSKEIGLPWTGHRALLEAALFLKKKYICYVPSRHMIRITRRQQQLRVTRRF